MDIFGILRRLWDNICSTWRRSSSASPSGSASSSASGPIAAETKLLTAADPTRYWDTFSCTHLRELFEKKRLDQFGYEISVPINIGVRIDGIQRQRALGKMQLARYFLVNGQFIERLPDLHFHLLTNPDILADLVTGQIPFVSADLKELPVTELQSLASQCEEQKERFRPRW